MRARWIDVGLSAPALFHASYVGLAEVQDGDALPIVLWGRTPAHFCLGATQSAAIELNPDLSVPVCQRPLGGGAVWLDENQYCYVLVAPQALLPRSPRDWFQGALAPAVATYNDFALKAMQVEHDIWLNGKKIGGSGAASINHCGVIASSFLMHFPAEQFADCMRAPNAAFRQALVDGLKDAMTDWGSHQTPPDEATLARVFQARLEAELGWRCEPSNFSPVELAARNDALEDVTSLQEDSIATTRRKIKLNARMFLNERKFGQDWVRIVTVGTKIQALELSINLPPMLSAGLINLDVNEATLTERLSLSLAPQEARHWAQLIYQTAWDD